MLLFTSGLYIIIYCNSILFHSKIQYISVPAYKTIHSPSNERSSHQRTISDCTEKSHHYECNTARVSITCQVNKTGLHQNLKGS